MMLNQQLIDGVLIGAAVQTVEKLAQERDAAFVSLVATLHCARAIKGAVRRIGHVVILFSARADRIP